MTGHACMVLLMEILGRCIRLYHGIIRDDIVEPGEMVPGILRISGLRCVNRDAFPMEKAGFGLRTGRKLEQLKSELMRRR